MKLFRNIYLFVSGILLAACNNTEQAKTEIQEKIDDVIISNSVSFDTSLMKTHAKDEFPIPGLKNSDLKDTIYIYSPLTDSDQMECLDSLCTTHFQFANPKYPGFSQDQALGGVVGNAGDLDDDGICEVYFVPDWFTSSWTGLNIYSLKNNSWKKIANASVRREDFVDESDKLYLPYSKRIIKHDKEYFEVIENVLDDADEKLVPKKFYFK